MKEIAVTGYFKYDGDGRISPYYDNEELSPVEGKICRII